VDRQANCVQDAGNVTAGFRVNVIVSILHFKNILRKSHNIWIDDFNATPAYISMQLLHTKKKSQNIITMVE
jgi:hypothetical protein